MLRKTSTTRYNYAESGTRRQNNLAGNKPMWAKQEPESKWLVCKKAKATLASTVSINPLCIKRATVDDSVVLKNQDSDEVFIIFVTISVHLHGLQVSILLKQYLKKIKK